MHRRLVEEKFQRKNGYEADCDVIYGDTDSVMVNFRVKDIARAMELGREAAAFVSKTFIKPIKLEFEKVCTEIPRLQRETIGVVWGHGKARARRHSQRVRDPHQAIA